MRHGASYLKIAVSLLAELTEVPSQKKGGVPTTWSDCLGRQRSPSASVKQDQRSPAQKRSSREKKYYSRKRTPKETKGYSCLKCAQRWLHLLLCVTSAGIKMDGAHS